MLLPLIGAGLGGFEGYRRSGGDLGAALLGAGLGAATPIGLRMAGTALGTGLAGKGLASGAANLVGMGAKQARLASMPGIAAKLREGSSAIRGLTPAALGGLAATGGVFLGVPALAGALSAGAAKPIGQAAQAITGGVGAAGEVTGLGQTQLPGTPGYGADQLTPGQLSQYGPQNLGQTFDHTGYQMTQLALEDEQFRRNLRNTLQALPYQEAYQQRSKEADLLRGAKATQLATALATDAAMRRQGQLGAQAMGEGLMRNVGQAGATQYRYF